MDRQMNIDIKIGSEKAILVYYGQEIDQNEEFTCQNY